MQCRLLLALFISMIVCSTLGVRRKQELRPERKCGQDEQDQNEHDQDENMEVDNEEQMSLRPFCATLFSEVYLYQESWFFEFMRVCEPYKMKPPDTPLEVEQNTFVVIEDDPATIIMTWDMTTNATAPQDKTRLYIGKASESEFETALHQTMIAVPTSSLFAFRENSVYAAMVLRGKHFPVLTRTQGNTNIGLKVDGSVVNALVRNAVDMVIVSWGANCRKMSASLLTLVTKLKVKPVTFLFEKGQSYNLCPTFWFTVPFSGRFELAGLTPGKANNCEVSQSVCHAADIEVPRAALFYPPIEEANIREIYRSAFRCEKSVPSQQPLKRNLHGMISVRSQQVEVLRDITQLPIQDSVAQTCSNFLTHHGHLLFSPVYRSWIQMERQGHSCVASCFDCDMFLGVGMRPDKHGNNLQESIMNGGFKFSENPNSFSQNTQRLVQHALTPLHRMAQIFKSEIIQAGNDKEIEDIIERYIDLEDEFYRPTAHVIIMVYAEILTGSSFAAHPTFMEALKYLGVNIGVHLYSSDSAKEISVLIGNGIRKNILKNITDENNEFSLIVDGSTDIDNKAYIAVVLQTSTKTKGVTYLYALLHVTSESSASMSDALETRVNDDDTLVPGFAKYFREKIISFVSDNAAAMCGRGNSFHTKLQTWVQRKVAQIGCQAHKLQLCYKAALQPQAGATDAGLKYFSEFHAKVNDFHKFYFSWGSKRSESLYESYDEFNLPKKKLKKIFEIRWVASLHDSVKDLISGLPAVSGNLKKMKQDRSQTRATRTIAHELYNVVCDKLFQLTLHEMFDFLSVLKKASLLMQESDSNILKLRNLLRSVLDDLQSLHHSPGTELKKFITSCSCLRVCEASQCELSEVLGCESPVCGGIELKNRDTTVNAFDYTDTRRIIYTQMTAEVNKRYDLDLADDLQVLDFSAMDGVASALQEPVIRRRFYSICDFLGKDDEVCDELVQEFIFLLKNVQRETGTGTESVGSWRQLCQNNKVYKDLENFVASVLIIPVGSAECERVFSIMNHIKTKSRNRLHPKTLEALIMTKFNALTLEEFDVSYFTRMWLKDHWRADDGRRYNTETQSSERNV